MRHKPWQQGHFDGLCGIYSLLNSMMYLHQGQFSEDDCETLFAHLVGEAMKSTPNVVCEGLDFEPLCAVAATLPAYLAAHGKAPVSINRPFADPDVPVTSTDAFFEQVSRMIKAPDACAVVGLGEPWDHWTVISKVTPKAVRFYDSYGIRRFDKRVFDLAPGEGKIAVDVRETILIQRLG